MSKLLLAQVRLLRALLPDDPNDPPTEWPLLTRACLNQRAGFTEKSGSITKAINGGKGGSKSNTLWPGLLELGLVSRVMVDIDGVMEDNYQITPNGIIAHNAWAEEHGELRAKRIAASCVNKRYKKGKVT